MQSLFEQLKIEKVYELLFPEKKKGLAVIWLYERVKNGEFEHGIFKEKDIHHAFEAVSLIKREPIYNPQIQISAESETKRSIFRKRNKTKRSKKESAQHSKNRNKRFVMTSVSAL